MVYDAIIIGSGGAAYSAAITLKEQNKNILIITKGSGTNAQTSQAQGGMNGVLAHREDSVESHIQDTLKSAHNLGNKEMITYMCEHASEAITWLDSLGVPFNRDSKNTIDARKLGGASAARANYSSDYSGLKILQTLYDKVISLQIPILEDSFVLSLLQNDPKSICGVSVLDMKTTQISQYLAKNVIMASGGYGGVYHNFTTNSADTTGDGIVLAYKAGASIENMELVQFHPTALKDKFILVSESARGEGGYLVTKNGDRFVDELLPRDIVAREIYKKFLHGEEVYLDLRHLGYEKIHHLMPQEYKITLDYLGIQMDKELVPIIPAVHYSMGGIKVNQDLKTSLNNLYAIGECSSCGVHGANRLGGNSLLEIVVMGRKVARALEYTQEIEQKEYDNFLEDKKYIENIFEKEGEAFYKDRNTLGKKLYYKCGVFRNKIDLQVCQELINDDMTKFDKYALSDKSKIYNLNLKHYLEFSNILECARLIVESAISREESRGAHYRDDFKNEDEKAYNIVIQKEKGVMKQWL